VKFVREGKRRGRLVNGNVKSSMKLTLDENGKRGGNDGEDVENR